MTSQPIPDSLRRELEKDLKPIRPLPPAWQRSLAVAAVAALVAAFALATLKLRFDLEQIPMWLSWGCTLLELLVGVLLVGVALRESVPGGGVPHGAAWLAAATGIGLQVLLGVGTWLASPGMPVGDSAMVHGMGCLRHECAIILPTFVVGLWLVFRALPTRAPTAGLLGGVGAAVAGDAVMHLMCPVSDLRHVLVWHTGAVVLYGAAGWAIGRAWEAIRWRRR